MYIYIVFLFIIITITIIIITITIIIMYIDILSLGLCKIILLLGRAGISIWAEHQVENGDPQLIYSIPRISLPAAQVQFGDPFGHPVSGRIWHDRESLLR